MTFNQSKGPNKESSREGKHQRASRGKKLQAQLLAASRSGKLSSGQLSAWFGDLGLWMAQRRYGVLCSIIASLFVAIFFASKVGVDSSLESYFNVADPSHQAYSAYQNDFGSDEVAILVYSAPQTAHGPFDLEVMRKIDRLTVALGREIPFVEEVTSLTNAEIMTAKGDLLEIQKLSDAFPDTQQDLLAWRDVVLKKPIFVGGLVNETASHAAIIMEMSRTSTDPLDALRADPDGGDGLENLYPQVSKNKILELIAHPDYEGIEFYFTGDVPLSATYNEIIGQEAGLLSVLSLLFVAILAMGCFRLSLVGLVGPLLVVTLGLMFTIGFMGFAGFKLGMMFLLVPTLLIAIGVAQTAHIITEFNLLRAAGLERLEAIRATFEHVGAPCFLAALTTSVGFFAMTVSKLQAVSEVAIYMAVGVFLSFMLSMAVMVCFFAFSKENSKTLASPLNTGTVDTKHAQIFAAFESGLSRFLSWTVDMSLHRRVAIFLSSLLVLAICVMGIARLNVGFNFLSHMKDDVPFKHDTLAVEEVLGGLLNVVYIFDTQQADGVKKAEILSYIDAIQARADQHPSVKKTYSLADIVKDLNQSFHQGDEAFAVIPENSELISQYLLLYEIAGGGELTDYVSDDFERAVLELRVASDDSDKIAAIFADLDAEIEKQSLSNVSVQSTGVGLLWIKMAEYVADSQAPGYIFAFGMIAVILSLAYGSLKLGLLAMIPNLTPVVVVLGVMGWAGIHLDYMRLLLSTVAIGIAVDDTVHMLSRFKREYEKSGDYEAALRNSLPSVGRALIFTTIILVCSFTVYFFSSMAVLASFGLLLGIAISAALIADLFLLPALLMAIRPFEAREMKISPAANQQGIA